MSLRISSAAACALLVAACGAESAPPEGDAIECAIGSGVEMSEVCTLERADNDGAVTFLLHHPDGGFRRIAFSPESQQLGVADGADTLRISNESTDELTEFTIGPDRYRIASWLIRQPGPAE